MNLTYTLTHAFPGSIWSCSGSTAQEQYATLDWQGPGPKPTFAEIEAAWDKLQNPPKPELFTTVTMGALRLALGRDLCIQVGAWIQGIQDATQKFQAQTWWEYSPTVRSNHTVVEQFRVALNKTPEEVAAYFSAAYAIDNP